VRRIPAVTTGGIDMTLETESITNGWERRVSPRRQMMAGAVLSFGGGKLDCTVRDISDTGVAISLTDWQETPDTVDFVLCGENTVRHAFVVRRLAPNMALHFLDAA
jgi:hypothetical protein